jgi:hypothetical protein
MHPNIRRFAIELRSKSSAEAHSWLMETCARLAQIAEKGEIMRLVLALVCIALLALPAPPAKAEPLESQHREENVIWLNGPISDQDTPWNAGEATNGMVCGMKFRTSTLSVRAQPDVASEELAVAPYYAVMHLTGELTYDKSWAKVEAFSILFTTDGRRLDEALHSLTEVSGWVSRRYLCDFVDM